jgi:hypothetical protein
MEIERKNLHRLICRSKYQHKSAPMLRKMTQLNKLLIHMDSSEERKRKIMDVAMDLYIICSRELSMGFFIPLNLCLMATVSRIFYLANRVLPRKSTAIDIIFSTNERKN